MPRWAAGPLAVRMAATCRVLPSTFRPLVSPTPSLPPRSTRASPVRHRAVWRQHVRASTLSSVAPASIKGAAGRQDTTEALEAACLRAGQAAAARVTQHYKGLARDPASGYRPDPLLAEGVPRVSDLLSPGGDADGGAHLQWVDLVMAGGGMLGIAHVGYTFVLEALGVRFHSVAGTSAGAINAALVVALRQDPSQPSSRNTLIALADCKFEKFMDGPDTAIKLTDWLLGLMKQGEPPATEKDLAELDKHDSDAAELLRKELRAAADLPQEDRPGAVQDVYDKARLGVAILTKDVPSRGAAAARLLARVAAGAVAAQGLTAAVTCVAHLPPATALPLAGVLLVGAAAGWWVAERIDWVMDALGAKGLHEGKEFKRWLNRQLRQGVDGKPLTDEEEAPKVTVAEIDAKLRLDGIPFQTFQNGKGTPVRVSDAQEVDPDYQMGRLALVAADVTTETLAEFPKHAHLYYADAQAAHVADFVRASMSVPGFFQPHVVKDIPRGPVAEAYWATGDDNSGWDDTNGHWRSGVDYHTKAGLPKDVTFVDGGVISNFPIAVFHKRDAVPNRPTFGVMFGGDSARRLRSAKRADDDNDAFLSTPNAPQQSASSLLAASFNTARHVLDREFIAHNPDYKQLVTAIDTGGAAFLDFNMSDAQKVALFQAGADAAAEFLIEFDWQTYKQTRASMLSARQTANKQERQQAAQREQLQVEGDGRPGPLQPRLPKVAAAPQEEEATRR